MSSTVFMTSPISIHAPREGSDGLALPVSTSTSNFYPRSPRGERRFLVNSSGAGTYNFYPRSPRGERRNRA